ncbi:MAG: HAMP domain-containing histidine kinase [Solirubrobacterales bacterium]|nr:HAMP domain-containing histidine kinase [Solirubrobacterales bacterium]
MTWPFQRRRRLNRALHELRRPLQALMLLDVRAHPLASSDISARRGLLELTAVALEELECEVNGGSAGAPPRPVSCRELLLATIERWQPLAASRGGEIKVFWDAGSGVVEADAARLGRAFDNLIENALVHGLPPVTLTGTRVGSRLRITIADGGAAPVAGNGGSDPRHGHGLEIVSELAASHGGRFALRHGGAGAVAALELPLAEPEAALVA